MLIHTYIIGLYHPLGHLQPEHKVAGEPVLHVLLRAVVVSVLNIYSFNLRPSYNVFTEQSKHDTTDIELRFGM